MKRSSALVRWISCLSLAVLGALLWRAIDVRQASAAVELSGIATPANPTFLRPPDPPQASGELEARTSREALPGAAASPESVAQHHAGSSTLARWLDDVAASFLGEQPRVTELLDLVEVLAGRAEVLEDSVEIQRSRDGVLVSARGALSADDLDGTFLVDPDGYHVRFSSTDTGEPWARRDVLITFEAEGERVRGCHAIVQFHPSPSASRALASGAQWIVGWSVGTGVGGTRAQPLVLSAAEDGWRIVSSSHVPDQELPWLRATSAFHAWLHSFEPLLAH